MATQSSPEPTPTSSSRSSSNAEWLRPRLRLRLERHLNTDAFCPALTVVGFREREAHVLRRGTDHPEDAVLGFTLPARYDALGILASSVVATPPQRDHRDAALAIGVDRGGNFVSLLATHQGVADTYQPQGWLADACLRAVDRPTPPCDIAPLAYPVALWLDRLMVTIVTAESSAPLRWADAVASCPVPRPWQSLDAFDLGTTLGSTARSWAALRDSVLAGGAAAVQMTPRVARWMDEPMFARWCMGSFPDLASLRGDVEFLAPAEVAEQIEITLRAAWLAVA